MTDGRKVTGNEIAKELHQFVDKSMCSTMCPCASSMRATWVKAANETEVKKFSRSWNSAKSASASGQFVNSKSVVWLDFRASNASGYKTFS